jgi:hypothetical protein
METTTKQSNWRRVLHYGESLRKELGHGFCNMSGKESISVQSCRVADRGHSSLRFHADMMKRSPLPFDNSTFHVGSASFILLCASKYDSIHFDASEAQSRLARCAISARTCALESGRHDWTAGVLHAQPRKLRESIASGVSAGAQTGLILSGIRSSAPALLAHRTPVRMIEFFAAKQAPYADEYL